MEYLLGRPTGFLLHTCATVLTHWIDWYIILWSERHWLIIWNIYFLDLYIAMTVPLKSENNQLLALICMSCTRRFRLNMNIPISTVYLLKKLKKLKNQEPRRFSLILTVGSLCKRKFVIGLLSDKETNGSYQFANGLNRLNRLAHLWWSHWCYHWAGWKHCLKHLVLLSCWITAWMLSSGWMLLPPHFSHWSYHLAGW